MRYLSSLLLSAALSLSAFAARDLGKPLTLKTAIPVKDLMSNAQASVGKTVQVKGRVTEVCRMMGCWMELRDESGEQSVRIKVNDGDIVFPKEAIGKEAVAEGKLTRHELTREQAVARAKHEAEEMGRKFDPSSIKSGITYYQIAGTGARILE